MEPSAGAVEPAGASPRKRVCCADIEFRLPSPRFPDAASQSVVAHEGDRRRRFRSSAACRVGADPCLLRRLRKRRPLRMERRGSTHRARPQPPRPLHGRLPLHRVGDCRRHRTHLRRQGLASDRRTRFGPLAGRGPGTRVPAAESRSTTATPAGSPRSDMWRSTLPIRSTPCRRIISSPPRICAASSPGRRPPPRSPDLSI